MMETITSIVGQFGQKLVVTLLENDVCPVGLIIKGMHDEEEVWLTQEQTRALATALLAAAGEPGATSKIVSNRAVIRPHVFEIGDDVETNDGIRGYIAGFQDATVIISTDNELLVQRSIADIEYTGDDDAAEDAK